MRNLKQRIRGNRFISKAIFVAYKRLFKIFSLLPHKKNRIVFESFLGKQYSDNPRAIFEYIEKNYTEYDLYWSVDPKYFGNDTRSLITVNRLSLKWLYIMATSKYWITNSRLPLWLPKPKHTIYVQTWHGTPLKKLGVDMEEVHMPGTNTESYKKNFLSEASKWDFLVSPNEYSTTIFKRAFGFKEKVIESGYPRNDYLVNNNSIEEITRIKKGLNLPSDKKVILYAPTWRDNQYYSKGRYKFDLNLDLNKLHAELSNDYIIVLRLHYLVAEELDLKNYKGFVYDLSKHEDIRELYLISDLLITDYSSVFFDYSILKRPILFYVYDIEEYRDKLRGFYFKFEEKAPGPLVKTTNDLINEIKAIESNDYKPTRVDSKFYKVFTSLEDGQATERVVKEILSK